MSYSNFVSPLIPRYSRIHNMTDCWAISSQAYRHGDVQFRVRRVKTVDRVRPYWSVSRWEYEALTVDSQMSLDRNLNRGWVNKGTYGNYENKPLAFAVAGSELTKAWMLQQIGREH